MGDVACVVPVTHNRLTGQDLLVFLTSEGQAGRMNAGTASSRRAAVRAVLRANFGEEWDTTLFDPDDAPRLAHHFATVRADDFAAGTHSSYRSDFVRTVQLITEEGEVDEPEDNWITYSFPIRPGANVEMRLPIDLTAREAKRLAALIVALPVDEPE